MTAMLKFVMDDYYSNPITPAPAAANPPHPPANPAVSRAPPRETGAPRSRVAPCAPTTPRPAARPTTDTDRYRQQRSHAPPTSAASEHPRSAALRGSRAAMHDPPM